MALLHDAQLHEHGPAVVGHTPKGIPATGFTNLAPQSAKFFSGDFASVVCAALADP
jgi:hypothetical protein